MPNCSHHFNSSLVKDLASIWIVVFFSFLNTGWIGIDLGVCPFIIPKSLIGEQIIYQISYYYNKAKNEKGYENDR